MIKIGEGKTGAVYSDGQYAYKKYHDNYDMNNIHYEVNVQNEIYENTDLNVAKYEIEDHTIKMTLFEGVTLADRILVKKYENWMEDFVELQSKTYSYRNLKLLDVFPIFSHQIRKTKLSESLKEKALSSLESIQKMDILCHFDFHPLNIIYGNNTYYIIDWTNAKLGNPAMDIASTYIIFRQYLESEAAHYLEKIAEKTNIAKNEIQKAIPIMAFIKLRENEESDQEELLTNLVLGKDLIE